MSRKDLLGKLVVVTGASSGIGAAAGRAFAKAGANVILVARRQELVARLADEINREGGKAHGYAADLTVASDVEGFANWVFGKYGVPDAVINNAGAGRFLFIEETTPEEAVDMMAAPYFAAFFTTRAFITAMLARGTGSVININSPVAYMPWPGAVGYASARFAIRGFTEALRQDLRGTGIRVASVTPTKVHSDYFASNPGAEERIPRIERLIGSTTPEHVADVVVHAVSHGLARDIHTPWRWNLAQPITRTFPTLFAWLSAVTGARRTPETTT